MQINWIIITYFVVGVFALAGLSRGWWKEALTTIFIAVLLFFLQQPELARAFVEAINSFFLTIWSIIPLTIQPTITDLLQSLFAIDTGGGPLQFEPSAPGTWVTILALTLTASILIGRAWLAIPPTRQGGLFGLVIGGMNGYLVLGLLREYLDGRALPGNEAPQSEIVLAGDSGFGAASSSVSIQAIDLPSFTIMDSVIPWVIIGVALLFLFSVLRTRLEIETNVQGMKRLNYRKIPPFYVTPKGPAPKDPIILVQHQG